MLNDANEILRNRWVITQYEHEPECDGCEWVAYDPDLPGCLAQGHTQAEAASALHEARIAYIAHLLEHRLPIPDSSAHAQTSIVQ